MKKILPFAFMASTLLLSFVGKDYDKKQNGYIIKGFLKGFADSTWIHLNLDNINRDSAMIIKGRFTFEGKVDSPVCASIYTRDPWESNNIWIENTKITIAGEKGKFKQAKVTGSVIQKEYDILKASLNHLEKRQDSLSTLLYESDLSKEEKKVLNQHYTKVREDIKGENIRFIKTYPGSLVSSYILNIYKIGWGKATAVELYDNLTSANKESEFGKAIADFIRLNQNVGLHDRYVDFGQNNAEGKEIRLSDFEGKVILLEFWGSWCGPCRRENPELVKTYNAFKDKGFEILGVAADTNKEHWLKAIEKDGLTWPQVSELNGSANTASLIYGVSGYPTNFLIAQDGTIIAKNLRGAALREKLEEIFNK